MRMQEDDMSQDEAARLAKEARARVNEAVAMIATTLMDPGPAAGPRTAAAGPLLEHASALLHDAGDETSSPALATQLRELARDAAARGREAIAIGFIPWPIVYAGIGALLSGTVALRDSIPAIVALEPAGRDSQDSARALATPTGTASTDFSAEVAGRWSSAKLVLEDDISIARSLSPALFEALQALRSIPSYPVETRDALLDLICTPRPDGSSRPAAREILEAFLFKEMFPISDKQDLARRLYPAFSYAEAARHGAVMPRKPTESMPDDSRQKVVWASFAAGTYRFDFSLGGTPRPDTWIHWERYSVFPPWYTWGSHNTQNPFFATFICDPYCDFWFSSVFPGLTWSISGHLTGCLP